MRFLDKFAEAPFRIPNWFFGDGDDGSPEPAPTSRNVTETSGQTPSYDPSFWHLPEGERNNQMEGELDRIISANGLPNLLRGISTFRSEGSGVDDKYKSGRDHQGKIYDLAVKLLHTNPKYAQHLDPESLKQQATASYRDLIEKGGKYPAHMDKGDIDSTARALAEATPSDFSKDPSKSTPSSFASDEDIVTSLRESVPTPQSKIRDIIGEPVTRNISEDIKSFTKGELGAGEFAKRQAGTGMGGLAQKGVEYGSEGVGGLIGGYFGSPEIGRDIGKYVGKEYLAPSASALVKGGVERVIESKYPGTMAQGPAEERLARQDFQQNVLPGLLEDYSADTGGYQSAKERLTGGFEDKLLARRAELGREERRFGLQERTAEKEMGQRDRQLELQEMGIQLNAKQLSDVQARADELARLNIPPSLAKQSLSIFLTTAIPKLTKTMIKMIADYYVPGSGTAVGALAKVAKTASA